MKVSSGTGAAGAESGMALAALAATVVVVTLEEVSLDAPPGAAVVRLKPKYNPSDADAIKARAATPTNDLETPTMTYPQLSPWRLRRLTRRS
jgi:hypothetical protein